MENYCLFSAKSCPYAHRCEILIHLLELPITIIQCDPVWTYKDGWLISNSNNPTAYATIKEMYEANSLDTKFTSLPVLYDMTEKKILFNDSIKIIKFLCDKTASDLDCDINGEFYEEFNTKISVGTYKAGHAKTADDYKLHFDAVFNYLDEFDNYIHDRNYIYDKLSLIDIIVYCHLIRFDLVFYSLFSLNKKHLWEYDSICQYMKRLSDSFAQATDIDEIKRGAYLTENNLPQNLGIKVPLGTGGIEYYL